MNRKWFSTAAVVLTLSATSLPSIAQRNDVELYGSPAAPSMHARTIVIHPDTRYVNVRGGEVIRFVVGDQVFVWNFDVAQTVSTFELNEVAPAGLLDHPVQVYVAVNPRTVG